MYKINALAYLGLALNASILAYTGFSEHYSMLFIPTLIAYLFCIAGIVLMILNKTKVGSIIFYIGSVLFIPLGMVGIMGVKKTVNDLEEIKFNKENYG
ncbi:hypothetical protein [Cellulophaga sp. Z1A5H]|uniref:hypothetical protein n=1 Tax=Cellulophaga sp. Z1A5H TaxID=2687291 RepID=UPI0013FD2C15|nr:hypothetical protein [Cellulophaga sp. Z1A5H]